jgi:hypothetical protein
MPTTAWADVSEIVAGLVLTGKLTPSAVRPSTLIEPYPRLWAGMKKTKKVPAPERVIELIGLPAYQAALHAAKTVKGLPTNWITVLEQSAARHDLGQTMQKMSQRLLHGEDIDLTKLSLLCIARRSPSPDRPLSYIPQKSTSTNSPAISLSINIWAAYRNPQTMSAHLTGKTYLAPSRRRMCRRNLVTLIFSMEMTARRLPIAPKQI